MVEENTMRNNNPTIIPTLNIIAPIDAAWATLNFLLMAKEKRVIQLLAKLSSGISLCN